jgi:raffinose/stachyose/melibiose transport system substrate-binding protein
MWPTQILASSWWVYKQREDPEFVQKMNRNEVTFAGDPDLLKAIEMYKDLQDKGYMNDNVVSSTYEEQLNALATGTAGMIFQISPIWEELIFEYPEVEDDIGMFVVPWPGASGLVPCGNNSSGISIYKNGPNVDVALDFLRYFASPEVASKYYSMVGMIAPYANLDYELASVNQTYVDMISKYGIEPSLSNVIDPGVGDDWMKAMVELLAGNITPVGVMERLDNSRAAQAKDMGNPYW